jgi:hypothetical protein
VGARVHAMADVFTDVGANLLWRRDDAQFGVVVSPSLRVANLPPLRLVLHIEENGGGPGVRLRKRTRVTLASQAMLRRQPAHVMSRMGLRDARRRT